MIDPEALRTRTHLDLLTRLIANLFARRAHAAGASVDEFVEELAQLLAEDQKVVDEETGKLTGDPALTALYTEEIRELFEDVRSQFRTAIEAVSKG